jgi:hypothetical protein
MRTPLNPGERFVGNIRDVDLLGRCFLGLDVRLRKPAFAITGSELPGYSAILLTVDDFAEYNRRWERKLKEMREGVQ